jgi:hypothetical protein
VKEQLKRAAQALEADAAQPAAADADGGGAGAQRGVAGKAQQRAKKADDYHARHAQWVAEFNELTGGECAGGEGGVKWAAVRAWQQKHWQANNLLADGLIGPKTIEAAKIVAKKNGAKDDKKDGKDAGDGATDKQHDAPQPGQADGAEAAADKPKMEEEADAQLKPSTVDGGDAKKADKPVSFAEFQEQLTKIEVLLAAFKPPQGRGPLKSVAENMMNGKGDSSAAPPTGAMMGAIDSYLAQSSKLADRWEKLDAQGRADFLLQQINRALQRELVPAIRTANLGSPEGTNASFDAAEWTLNVNSDQFDRRQFKGKTDKRKHVDGLASNVFHEGRHAEQRFGVARLLARQNKDVADIVKQAGVDEKVAREAKIIELEKKHPVSPEENQAAERMSADVVDKGPEHVEIEHLIPKIGAAGTEAAEMFAQLSPEDRQKVAATWQEYRGRMIVALDAYYQLPAEQDAYAAEKQLDDKRGAHQKK